MKILWKKRPPALIPLLCYGLALVLWLALCTLTLVQDKAAGIEPRTLSPAEIAIASLEQLPDGSLQATDTDPQLHWANTQGLRVRTLTMHAAFNKPPQVMSLYYLPAGAAAFSPDLQVYPTDNGDGSYTFVLPEAQVLALRLDPCSDACHITGLRITLNTAYPAWRYYLPGWSQAFWLLLWPGMAASGLHIAAAFWQRIKQRKPRR